MPSPQQEAKLPWEEHKEAMEMAKIPVVPIVEDEHIFHDRPPPDEGTIDPPPEEPPPEETEPPPEEPPPEEEVQQQPVRDGRY
jgi:hypothetical protein